MAAGEILISIALRPLVLQTFLFTRRKHPIISNIFIYKNIHNQPSVGGAHL